MPRLFVVLALLFSALDHWTTWLCLRAPVPGWDVREGNPLAAWLFGSFGLAEGLAIDSLVTLGAVLIVARTQRVARPVKLALLGLLIGSSAFAVANNFGVIQQIGLLATGAGPR